jgi:hypothetical protein
MKAAKESKCQLRKTEMGEIGGSIPEEEKIIYQSVYNPPHCKASWTPYNTYAVKMGGISKKNGDKKQKIQLTAWQQYAIDLAEWEKEELAWMPFRNTKLPFQK